MTETRRDNRETRGRGARRPRAPSRRRSARSQAGSPRVCPRADVSGLRGSSPVFVVEALRASLDRTAIVVCPDEETSAGRLRRFPDGLAGRVSSSSPRETSSPGGSSSGKTRTIRGRTSRVSRSAAPRRCRHRRHEPARLISKRRSPSEVFREHVIELALGASLDLDDLRGRLVLLGYEGGLDRRGAR